MREHRNCRVRLSEQSRTLYPTLRSLNTNWPPRRKESWWWVLGSDPWNGLVNAKRWTNISPGLRGVKRRSTSPWAQTRRMKPSIGNLSHMLSLPTLNSTLIIRLVHNQALAEQDRQLDRLPYADGAAFDSRQRECVPHCIPDTRVDLLYQLQE